MLGNNNNNLKQNLYSGVVVEVVGLLAVKFEIRVDVRKRRQILCLYYEVRPRTALQIIK